MGATTYSTEFHWVSRYGPTFVLRVREASAGSRQAVRRLSAFRLGCRISKHFGVLQAYVKPLRRIFKKRKNMILQMHRTSSEKVGPALAKGEGREERFPAPQPKQPTKARIQ